MKQLLISSNTFTTIKPLTAGSLLKTIANKITLDFNNNIVKCDTSSFSVGVPGILSYITSPDRGSTLDIVDAENLVVSDNNDIRNCYTASRGAAWSLTNSSMVDRDSYYDNLAALRGGVYYCLACASILS